MIEEKSMQIEEVAGGRADFGAVLQDQKTEIVGQMAGAMANQFNNIMMAITSYAELELKKAAPSQQRNLEQILTNTARATTLIQKLLSFSRKHSPAPRKFALNPVVEEISGVLPPLMGEHLEVSVKIDPTVDNIVADPMEIEQLVLSLGLNARDSMNHGGILQIFTELVNLEGNSENGDVGAAGPHAMLCLRYTPSSKPGDEPVGNQDLRITRAIAAVRTIVKERKGQFRISSRPGQSTTFRVYFPSVSTEAIALKDIASTISAAPSTKTILIVEDDDAVRNPAAEFLKMEGFKVLQARTGPEALRIVQDSRSKLDLLITDIVMAGMHGNQVAEELQKTQPGLKVLFMSGDTQAAAKATKTTKPENMLQKPFRLNKLNDKIQELLGE